VVRADHLKDAYDAQATDDRRASEIVSINPYARRAARFRVAFTNEVNAASHAPGSRSRVALSRSATARIHPQLQRELYDANKDSPLFQTRPASRLRALTARSFPPANLMKHFAGECARILRDDGSRSGLSQ